MIESRTYSLATVTTVGVLLLLVGLGVGLIVSTVYSTSARVEQLEADRDGQVRLLEQHQKALASHADQIKSILAERQQSVAQINAAFKASSESFKKVGETLKAIDKGAGTRIAAAEGRLLKLERGPQKKEPKPK